jgi:hypothetical protein
MRRDEGQAKTVIPSLQSASSCKMMELTMSLIPDNSDALLTRHQTAAALTEAGYPVKPDTLATKATRGGGPPYQKFGSRVLYRWGSSLQWANDRLSDPVRSTSESQRAKRPSPL